MTAPDKDKLKALVALYAITLGTAFGAFCIYLGHNSTVIMSVFGLIGAVAGGIIGYAVGKTK